MAFLIGVKVAQIQKNDKINIDTNKHLGHYIVNMNKILFTLSDVEYKHENEAIEELNSICEHIGAKACIKRVSSLKMLEISYDEDELIKKTKRGAGRPTADLEEIMTLSQLKKMIADIGIEKTAKKLKISVRTLYRRLEKHKKSPGNTRIY